MQTGSFNWKWIVISVVIVSMSGYANVSSNGVIAAQESLEKARLELQEQGFKTDLANFDLATTPESRARETILMATAPRNAINPNRPRIDAACAAILSGPIQFHLDASAGNDMLLPHLAHLKNLIQMLNDRAMLALHEGNLKAA
jgi:hypothetical protein